MQDCRTYNGTTNYTGETSHVGRLPLNNLFTNDLVEIGKRFLD